MRVGDDVLTVDQAGMFGFRFFDERTHLFDVLVEGDGDDRESASFELRMRFLPDRQVVAAASPGRVSDQQDLATTVV